MIVILVAIFGTMTLAWIIVSIVDAIHEQRAWKKFQDSLPKPFDWAKDGE